MPLCLDDSKTSDFDYVISKGRTMRLTIQIQQFPVFSFDGCIELLIYEQAGIYI